MIPAASTPNRVLVELSPTGRCLAGVIDLRVGSGDRVNVGSRQRCDTAEALHEIEHHALGGEELSERSANRGERRRERIDSGAVASGACPLDRHRRIEGVEHDRRDHPSCEDAGLLGEQVKRGRLGHVGGEGSRHVARPEVLTLGQLDESAYVVVVGNRHRCVIVSCHCHDARRVIF